MESRAPLYRSHFSHLRQKCDCISSLDNGSHSKTKLIQLKSKYKAARAWWSFIASPVSESGQCPSRQPGTAQLHCQISPNKVWHRLRPLDSVAYPAFHCHTQHIQFCLTPQCSDAKTAAPRLHLKPLLMHRATPLHGPAVCCTIVHTRPGHLQRSGSSKSVECRVTKSIHMASASSSHNKINVSEN